MAPYLNVFDEPVDHSNTVDFDHVLSDALDFIIQPIYFITSTIILIYTSFFIPALDNLPPHPKSGVDIEPPAKKSTSTGAVVQAKIPKNTDSNDNTETPAKSECLKVDLSPEILRFWKDRINSPFLSLTERPRARVATSAPPLQHQKAKRDMASPIELGHGSGAATNLLHELPGLSADDLVTRAPPVWIESDDVIYRNGHARYITKSIHDEEIRHLRELNATSAADMAGAMRCIEDEAQTRIACMKVEHAATLSRAQKDSQLLSSVKDQNAAVLSSMEEKHKAALKSLRAEHKSSTSILLQQHRAQLAVAKTQQKKDVDEAKTRCEKEVASVEAKARERLAASRAQWQQKTKTANMHWQKKALSTKVQSRTALMSMKVRCQRKLVSTKRHCEKLVNSTKKECDATVTSTKLKCQEDIVSARRLYETDLSSVQDRHRLEISSLERENRSALDEVERTVTRALDSLDNENSSFLASLETENKDNEQLRKTISRLQAQIVSIKSQRELDIASMQRKHDFDITYINDAHKSTLRKLNVSIMTELASLGDKWSAIISRLETDSRPAIALPKTLDQQRAYIASIRSQYEAELASVKSAHKAEITSVRHSHESVLEKIETDIGAAFDDLQADYKSTIGPLAAVHRGPPCALPAETGPKSAASGEHTHISSLPPSRRSQNDLYSLDGCFEAGKPLRLTGEVARQDDLVEVSPSLRREYLSLRNRDSATISQRRGHGISESLSEPGINRRSAETSSDSGMLVRAAKTNDNDGWTVDPSQSMPAALGTRFSSPSCSNRLSDYGHLYTAWPLDDNHSDHHDCLVYSNAADEEFIDFLQPLAPAQMRTAQWLGTQLQQAVDTEQEDVDAKSTNAVFDGSDEDPTDAVLGSPFAVRPAGGQFVKKQQGAAAFQQEEGEYRGEDDVDQAQRPVPPIDRLVLDDATSPAGETGCTQGHVGSASSEDFAALRAEVSALRADLDASETELHAAALSERLAIVAMEQQEERVQELEAALLDTQIDAAPAGYWQDVLEDVRTQLDTRQRGVDALTARVRDAEEARASCEKEVKKKSAQVEACHGIVAALCMRDRGRVAELAQAKDMMGLPVDEKQQDGVVELRSVLQGVAKEHKRALDEEDYKICDGLDEFILSGAEAQGQRSKIVLSPTNQAVGGHVEEVQGLLGYVVKCGKTLKDTKFRKNKIDTAPSGAGNAGSETSTKYDVTGADDEERRQATVREMQTAKLKMDADARILAEEAF